MPAFYTDEQGRIRVIPDGKPLHANAKKQQGSQPRLSLPKFGENASGRLSHAPPRPLPYHNETDLAQKLYGHFVTGQGQPVEIDLGKLDFSQHVDARQLLRHDLRQALIGLVDGTKGKTINQDEKTLQQKLNPIQGKVLGSNEKLTVIEIKEPFKDDMNISLADPAKFAAFGKMPYALMDVELYINYQNKTVTVTGDITSTDKKSRKLDRFDFDPGKRSWYAETLVQTVHYGAPPGSTSFDIYARRGSSSRYKRTYTFTEFSR